MDPHAGGGGGGGGGGGRGSSVGQFLPTNILPKISKSLGGGHHGDEHDIDLESGVATQGDAEKQQQLHLRSWNSFTPKRSATNIILRSSRPATSPAKPSSQQTPDQSEKKKKDPFTLMTIPDELQILILSYLDFTSIIRLRRTSRYWRTFASPDLLRTIHGAADYQAMLLQHCAKCLAFCPTPTARVATKPQNIGYPLSSKCISCALQANDGTIRVGRQVKLADKEKYWVCRWCGWPVISGAYRSRRNVGHSEFHQKCYQRYFVGGIMTWFMLGIVQFILSVVGSALVWRFFRSEEIKAVTPTVIGFVLSLVCFWFIANRDCYEPTYVWSFFAEAAVLASWVEPMRVIILKIIHDSNSPSMATLATLAFVALNMLFRFLNVVGNILLFFSYDRTRHYLPRVPFWRKPINAVLTGLVIWTYPQHIYRQFVLPDEEIDDSMIGSGDDEDV